MEFVFDNGPQLQKLRNEITTLKQQLNAVIERVVELERRPIPRGKPRNAQPARLESQNLPAQ